MVAIEPIKTGRSVTHVELRWWRKDDDAAGAADLALQYSKVGRKVRAEEREGRARPAWLDTRGQALRTDTYETARMRHPGYDIYFIEGEWRTWAKGKPEAANPDRAFLAFFRKYAEANPL